MSDKVNYDSPSSCAKYAGIVRYRLMLDNAVFCVKRGDSTYFDRSTLRQLCQICEFNSNCQTFQL